MVEIAGTNLEIRDISALVVDVQLLEKLAVFGLVHNTAVKKTLDVVVHTMD